MQVKRFKGECIASFSIKGVDEILTQDQTTQTQLKDFLNHNQEVGPFTMVKSEREIQFIKAPFYSIDVRYYITTSKGDYSIYGFNQEEVEFLKESFSLNCFTY